jgi:hypothetical protein
MTTSFQLLNSFRGGEQVITTSTDPQNIVSPDFDPMGQGTVTTTDSLDTPIAPTTDTRVRLRAMRGDSQMQQVYGDRTADNILSILYDTDGMMFPYTPTIGVSQAVEYRSAELVHTNGSIETYTRTPSVTLSVTADFSVQNQREGRYALACLHFLRTVSKMYFGETDKAAGKAGLPPPVLIFQGYGNYMFNNLPVIVKSHSYSLDKSMNMVTVNTASGVAKLPALFSISMDLQVQQTPTAMRKEFSLDAFRTGALMRNGAATGWI